MSEKQRRWYQFRLSTILVLVAIAVWAMGDCGAAEAGTGVAGSNAIITHDPVEARVGTDL
ncbi:MAG: hypothetical protein KF708_04825 [Pirellulales bacterium]|nr:hypothetical protein [Pirellulales bacterium]